jgi:hypothetical protein
MSVKSQYVTCGSEKFVEIGFARIYAEHGASKNQRMHVGQVCSFLACSGDESHGEFASSLGRAGPEHIMPDRTKDKI